MYFRVDDDRAGTGSVWLAVVMCIALSSCVSSVDAVTDTASLAQESATSPEDELTSDVPSADLQPNEIAFVPTKAPRNGGVVQQLAEVASEADPESAKKDAAKLETGGTQSAKTDRQPKDTKVSRLDTEAADSKASGKPKKPTLLQRLLQARADKRAQEKQREAFRNARKSSRPRIVARARNFNGSPLPGVKKNSKLFGIGGPDDQDNIQVASVGGFGRLSPNGLRLQHSRVEVGCLKPGLLKVLKIVERKYRQKPIVTSGYRSPKRNRRAGGASNSQHIYCKAADIQLDGVSKWDLAKFLRSIPGRGGVGTYCRTKSVHIDVGPKRDWHHPCRRSVLRRKRKA